MTFVDLNNFIFELPANIAGAMGAVPFHFPCEPVSVGVGDRVPVRVKVTVGVNNQLIVTAKQATVQIPSTVTVQNPVRQHGSVGQEVTVGNIPTAGNPTLEEFARNGGTVGTTIFLPQGVQVDKYIKDMWHHLGRQIGTEVATDIELSKTLAESGDDFAKMADKLKKIPPAKGQQILQRLGVPFDKARKIAENAVMGAADEAAAGIRETLSRSQAVSGLRNLLQLEQLAQGVGC